MPATILDQSAVARLRHEVSGAVILPTDPAYDETRVVFNAMVDRQPAAFVQCETPDDVAVALRFAQEIGLEVAVRGGGHSVSGQALADDGLVMFATVHY